MTQALGKTIQIFLPDRNPCGVKIAEFTNWTKKHFEKTKIDACPTM